jgi:Predicted transcriptional regulators
MEHIGQKIKDLRKKADMTQDHLADSLAVSTQAVSKWECEETKGLEVGGNWRRDRAKLLKRASLY